jgi:DNA-binding transcriptional LysR family regulator
VAIYVIAQTDLVLTVQRRLAKIARRMSGMQVVESPREIKAFPYFMAWHPRVTVEPAHAWFRGRLRMAAHTI